MSRWNSVVVRSNSLLLNKKVIRATSRALLKTCRHLSAISASSSKAEKEKNSTIIQNIISSMNDNYLSGKTQSYEWRTTQIKTIHQLVKENTNDLLEALQHDLHKNKAESFLGEINTVLHETEYTLKHLSSWMKTKLVPSPALLAPAFSEIRMEPKGPCLVISPFNYPINLSLTASVGSLGAGNPTVLKPSDLTTETSAILGRLVGEYFDECDFAVVEGGVEETALLMKEKWGLVHFTGSERVGKIIALQAANTLTPTVLELGGKSPTYIDINCPDMNTVAKRIAWGKTFNSGQTCIAPDYVLCHEKHIEEFSKEVTSCIQEMFTSDPEQSEFARIASEKYAQRHYELLQEVEESSSTTNILFGGSNRCNVSKKYICPTVVVNPPLSSRLMKEEIFGPILPIVSVSSEEEAIKFIQNMGGPPLALYVFTTSSDVYNRMLKYCPSGSAGRNEVMMQVVNPYLPFGGKGNSGYGMYHGEHSFNTFSHHRASLYRPCYDILGKLDDIRCHPFTPQKETLIAIASKLPDIPHLYSKQTIFTTALACIGLVGFFGM